MKCHVGGPSYNFSYVGDFTFVASTATALNDLLAKCDHFAQQNFVVYSAPNSVLYLAVHACYSIQSKPSV